MTREDAIKFGKRVLSLSLFDETHEFCEIAVKALEQVSEIEENIIKYMKKYPNHVGNTDFWEGFYACRNVVLQLDDEYLPKEQEPISVSVSEKEPDEISEEVTLRFFRNSLKVRWQDMVIYNVEWLKKNWQMEMDIVCGVKPCEDAVSRQAVLEIAKQHTLTNDYLAIQNLPSVTQKPIECDDVVSRQAVEEMIKAEMPERGMWEIDGDKEKETVCEVCVDLTLKLSCLPSVRPQEQTGHWNLLDECANSGYYCSICKKKLVKEGWSKTVKKIKYCPNCGAKMQERSDKE